MRLFLVVQCLAPELLEWDHRGAQECESLMGSDWSLDLISRSRRGTDLPSASCSKLGQDSMKEMKKEKK